MLHKKIVRRKKKLGNASSMGRCNEARTEKSVSFSIPRETFFDEYFWVSPFPAFFLEGNKSFLVALHCSRNTDILAWYSAPIEA